MSEIPRAPRDILAGMRSAGEAADRAAAAGGPPRSPGSGEGGGAWHLPSWIESEEGAPGETSPWGAEAPGIDPNPIAPDAGPSRRQVLWESSKIGGRWLKDTFWTKEDVKASLLTGAVVGLATAGLKWGTGGTGLAISFGFGAGGAAIRAIPKSIYKQHTRQITEIQGWIEASKTAGEDYTTEEQSLEALKHSSLLEKFRATKKGELAGDIVRAAAWGGLGGVVGFEIKELGVLDFIKDRAGEHVATTIGTLSGTAGGLLLRWRNARAGGDSMRSRKTIFAVLAGAVVGGVVGGGAEAGIGQVGSLAGSGARELVPVTPTMTIPAAETPVVPTQPAVVPGSPGPVESPAVRPAVSPVASPEGRATATPTEAPTKAPATATPRPTITPDTSPQRGVPTLEPAKPRPVGSLPGGLDQISDNSGRDKLPVQFAAYKISPPGLEDQAPALRTAAALSIDQGQSVEASILTASRDANVHAQVASQGADNYAKALEEVFNDPKNTEKLNPFNEDLPPVTKEGVIAAQQDAYVKRYEFAKASEGLAREGNRLAADRANIDALNQVAQTEQGQFEGAQAYAQDLEDWKGAVDAHGHRINDTDILLANEEAAKQGEEASSAIRNLRIVQNPNNYAPTPQELMPPEVKARLPNFFEQDITIKPGSSFWQSFKIPDNYFADGTPWVNPENGVSQADVIKDMLRKFAIANGHPIDRIGAGTVSLEDLELTDDQKFAIRKVLATRNVKQYVSDGAMAAFQSALKKAA